ncbi:MAG: ABC transporter substrate-binding protein, partial [Proteobacteria bacterium]|nr:ABC transporter substrate-binding protein [Pseudomonadota bacterium]
KNREFVEAWKKEYNGLVPDQFEGEQWQAQKFFEAGITKAGGIEADKLRPALEELAIDDIKGKVQIRKCDHQAVQPGYIFKASKREGFSHPVPEIIATYPGDKTTPACNKMTYDN